MFSKCYANLFFDRNFRYIVVGWEETTHDSRVLMETNHNPPYKSFLCPHQVNIFSLFYLMLFIFNKIIVYSILFFFHKILFSVCSIYTHLRLYDNIS